MPSMALAIKKWHSTVGGRRPAIRASCALSPLPLRRHGRPGLAPRLQWLFCAVFCLVGAASFGQVPVGDLAKVPADARHFVIESTGGKHGDSWIWVTSSGMRMGRESMNLRGQVWEVDLSGTAGPDGLPAALTIRGISPQGDVGETFRSEGGTAQWRSPVDAGSTSKGTHAYYVPLGGPIEGAAWLLESLLAQADQSLDLLPGGKAHAEKLSSIEIGTGAERKTIVLWAISGLSNSPALMWADEQGRFFGQTAGLGWLPEAYAGEQQRLEREQARAMAVRTAALARSLASKPGRPLAFVNVQVFDAERLRFLSNQSVLVDGSKITAAGPAATVAVPPDAMLIDGKGMTL